MAQVASATPAKHHRTPHSNQSSVNNLVGSPPARSSWRSGDAETPCSSPVSKMAKTTSPAGPSWTIMDAACDSPSPPKMAKTPSPAGPSWTIRDAACDSPSLPKTVWTSTPPTGSWPMSFSSAPTTSHFPAKEVSLSPPQQTNKTGLFQLKHNSSTVKTVEDNVIDGEFLTR
ncbi:polycystic kidney disease protein 1-like 3 [Larimichthys crocea]|uniref:polycystic kidney disease protein 1-like 3 n=1 Tax=Larimichthys crocea TaxID=215358 RepID=UPI000F5F5487|nr:polycystic kidney disease protein 1-like 3 [Larimichthys crocea]